MINKEDEELKQIESELPDITLNSRVSSTSISVWSVFHQMVLMGMALR